MPKWKLAPPDLGIINNQLGPEFLESLQAYFDRFSDRRLLQVRRDVALFAIHLIETRSRHSLCDAYTGNAVPVGSDLNAELTRAVDEAVAKHRAAGISETGVTKYTSGVRGAVRYLSKLKGRPDLGPHRVRHLKARQPQGNRRDKGGLLVPYIDMDQVGALVSEQFASDLVKVCKTKREAASIRAFLTTLIRDNSSSSRKLVIILSSGEGRTEGAVALVVAALQTCEAQLMTDFGLTRDTVRDRLQCARTVLERLGKIGDRNYPAFRKSNFIVEHHGTDEGARTLVDLSLSIETTLKGASRQRAALAVLRDAAHAELAACVRIFERMQRIMKGEFDDLNGIKALALAEALRIVLIAEDKSFKATSYSQFHVKGERSNRTEVDEAVALLSSRDAWTVLGLEEATVLEKRIGTSAVRRMILMGLGATRRAVHACMIVFCCEHGWNLQPMWDIPLAPFFFEVEDSVTLGSLSYIAAFKNKAGHEVMAMLERHGTRPEIVRERVMHAWEATSKEGHWGDNDHSALLNKEGAARKALSQFGPLGASARAYTSSLELRDRFFVILSQHFGIVGFQSSLRIAGTFSSAPLNTHGLTFPLIRKSFQQLKLREVGSVEGLRPVTGHAKTNNLQRFYVNSDDVVRETLESIRFFQNALQALVVSETGISGALTMDDKTLEWFYNLAELSGIAGAIGLGASTPAGIRRGVYNFDPTDVNVRSLVAIHLSLKRARRHTEPYRFAIYGVPLLGFVVAIEGKLRLSGLTVLFRQTARQVLRDLKANKIELPSLF